MLVFILSFAYLFTCQTSDAGGDIIKHIWDLLPKIKKEYHASIPLRDYKENAQLYNINIKEENGQKKIIWKYDVTFEGLTDFSDAKDKIEHFFTTTKTSGLGTPLIKEIKGPNGIININSSNFTDDKINTCKSQFAKPSDFPDGTYEFTIETPITELRENYTLYVNTQLTANMYKGEYVPKDGGEGSYQFDKDSVIKAPSMLSLTVKAEDNYGDDENISLAELKEDMPNFTELDSNGIITQGSYISDSKIRWTSTFMNKTLDKTDLELDMTADSSQNPGRVKLFYYMPGENGYEKIKEEEIDASKITIKDIEPSTIVEAILETSVNNNGKTQNHSLGADNNATLESFYGGLTINKIWLNNVVQDAEFTIDGQKVSIGKSYTGKTIDGHPSTTRGPFVKQKFKQTNDRIKKYKRQEYEVLEIPQKDYKLSYYSVDRENLIYNFANAKRQAAKKEEDDDDSDDAQCKVIRYGIYEIDPVYIHSYWYSNAKNSDWFGYGGGISGKFRIPAGASQGDYFRLKIPKELKIEKEVSETKAWTKIYDSHGLDIGELYLTDVDELTFKLNSNANKNVDYTGNFYIGVGQKGNNLIKVDGKNVSPKEAEKYLYGVIPVQSEFYDKDNPKNKLVTENLEFKSEYVGEDLKCSTKINQKATVNYTDDTIKKQTAFLNKYVVEDDHEEQSLTYEIVFNGSQDVGVSWFEDYLNETIELFHGNNDWAIEQDIQVYYGNPTASNSVAREGLVQIYPNSDNVEGSPSVEISGHPYEGSDSKAITLNGGRITEKFRIRFDFKNLKRKAILVRLKAKKKDLRGSTNVRPYLHNNKYYYYNRVKTKWFKRDVQYVSNYAETKAGASGSEYDESKGRFRIRKVDKNKIPIIESKAEFLLRGGPDTGNYAAIRKTDEHGYISFESLIPGKTYILSEKKSPKGYKKNFKKYEIKTKVHSQQAGAEFKVDITIKELPNGKEIPVSYEKPVDIVNEKIPKFIVKKIDKSTKLPLKGAAFRLTKIKDAVASMNDSDNSNKQSSYDVSIGRGQNMSEFVFDDLSPGQYKLEEVQVPKGYKKMASFVIDVSNEGTSISKIRGFDPNNNSADQDTKKTANGFEIHAYNNKIEPPKKNIVRFVKTNQFGRRLRDDLYNIIKEKIANGEIYTYPGENLDTKFKGLMASISDNVKFTVYRTKQNWDPNFGMLTTKDGTKITPVLKREVSSNDNDFDEVNAKMNENTSEFEFYSLKDGKYWLVEGFVSKFQEKYELFKEIYGNIDNKILLSFEIENNRVSKVNGKPLTDSLIEVVNEKKATKFTIEKVDKVTKKALPGAEFTLYKGKEEITRQYSDSKGIVTFDDIGPGTYRVVESKAPRAYKKSKTEIKVVVDSDLNIKINNQAINEIQVSNEKQSGISIIKLAEDGKALKGRAKFCIIPVDKGVSKENFEEALRTNGNRNARNCIWHENTDDKGDDSIKLNGKIYYLPKHSKVKNKLENYQLFDVVDGSLERTNIKFKNPGKYIFAEYDAPKGYDIIKPVLLELKEVQGQLTYNIISGNSELTLDNHSEIMKFTAKDKIIRSKFALKKVKETANKNRNPIGVDFTESKDVSFRLTKTKREIAARSDYDESDIDKTFATNGRVDKTWKTNQDVVFDNLRPGYYVLEETKFPEEYIKTGETYRINVDDKGSIDFSIYSKEGLLRKYFITQFEMDYLPWFKDDGNLVRIGNRQEPKGKFAFYKKAESTTNPMAAIIDQNALAKFKLTKDGDSSFSALEQTKKASEKFIFENLKKGTYTLEETQAPTGYLKTAKKYKISVDELGDVRIFEPTAEEDSKQVGATFSHSLKTNSISNISSATDGNEENEAVFNLKNSKIEKGDYIQLDLGSIHYISKVKLLQNIKATSGNNDAFDDVDLEYSLDGTTFHKLKNYANTNPNKGTFDNSIRTIEETTPFFAKVVRIRNNVESGGRWLRLNEFRVEGYPVSLKKEISLENQKDLASKDNYIFEIGNLEIPKIKLIKTDEKGNTIGSANAEFELRKVQDDTSNVNNLTEASGELVYKILVKDGISKLIDSKGEEVSDNQLSLDTLGKYILVEKTSPKSYKKLDKPILLEAYQDQVAITGGKKKVLWFKNVARDSNLNIGLEENGRLIKFSVKNKKIQSKFAFKKKIQSATNKPMQDIPNVNLQAEFKLTKDGLLSGFNPVIKKQNVSTIFEFANLEAGDYTLEETLAPAGFMKTNDKYKVKIDEYGNVVVYKDATNKTPAKVNASLSHNFGSIQIENLANATDDDDNNEATFHLSGSKLKKGDYLQLAFNDAHYVTSLKFLQNTVSQNTGRDIFEDFDIEYSLDGTNFYKAASYKKAFVDDKAIKTINLSNPFVAKYVRIRSNVESGSRWLRVASFEAQGYRVEPVKDLGNERQDTIVATDIFDIGNLENPKIKIIKQDDNGNEINNADAEFELRKVDDGTENVDKLDENSGELVHKISIENGQTKLNKADGTEIEGNQLQIEKLGKYILVEKVPPRGYRKLDKPILLNVKEDKIDKGAKKISWFEIKPSTDIAKLSIDTNNGVTAVFRVKNEEIKSKFAFKKKAESLKEPMVDIAGDKTATFKLTKDGDKNFSQTLTKKVNETFEFTELKKGDYSLEETQAPSGFVKTDKLYRISIDDEGTVRIFKASKDSQNTKIQNPKFGYKMNAEPKNPGNATDGIENNESVFELSNSTVRKDDFIKLSFDKVHHISKIKLLLNNARATAGNDIFDDADLEYSLDGKTFVKYKNYKSGKRIEEDVDLYAKEIRYRSNTQAGGRWFSVSEFEAYGYEADLVKELSQKDQENLKPFDIGNLQNPRLVLEKIDGKTNELIDTNKVNKDYTAKFALYKIPDDAKSFDNLSSNDKKKLKDFTLVNGRIELADDSITELGRYALCESESPDDYQIINPIILDLVKVKGATGTKLSLGWKLVSEPLKDGVYKLQAQDDNKKFDDKIEIDYSKLFDNDPAITLRVKNYRDDRGKFEFDKVDKASKNLNGASFKLTKDDDNNFTPIIRDGTNTSRFAFENLSPGTYTLEETVVPTGYMKEDKILKAFVNDYGDTSLFTIKGKETVGKIPLTKDNLIYSDRYNKYIADEDKAKMFDNNKDSVGEVKLWSQSVGDYVDKDEFVGIDLKGLYRIDSFDFNQGPVQGSNTGNDAYDEYVIEYSLDGSNYRRFRKYKNPNAPNKPSDYERGDAYDISENLNTYARYIRVRNLTKATGRWLRIRNISATGYKVDEIQNFRKNDTIAPAKIENIKIKKVKLKIAKLDLDGNSIRGDIKTSARFFISKTDSQDENNKYNGQVADLKDGAFTFDNKGQLFEPGLYYLVESRAPKGYMKLSKPIPFFIENDGRLIIPAKLKEGSTKEYVKDENFINKDYIEVKQDNSDENLVTINVKNQKFTYPRTGGRGIIFLSIIGALVMSLGIFLYQRKTSIER